MGWVKCMEGERSLAKLSRSTLGAVVTLVSTSAVDCSRLVVRGGRGVMQWCDGSRFWRWYTRPLDWPSGIVLDPGRRLKTVLLLPGVID